MIPPYPPFLRGVKSKKTCRYQNAARMKGSEKVPLKKGDVTK